MNNFIMHTFQSLCIKAEEKVWGIRVDLNVLNHEGNLTGIYRKK